MMRACAHIMNMIFQLSICMWPPHWWSMRACRTHDEPIPLLAAVAFSPHRCSFIRTMILSPRTPLAHIQSLFFFEKGAGALLIQLHHLPFYSTVCSVPFLCTHLNPCLSLAPFCSLLLVTFRLKNEYTCIWPRL
jgi:hypothetical protein